MSVLRDSMWGSGVCGCTALALTLRPNGKDSFHSGVATGLLLFSVCASYEAPPGELNLKPYNDLGFRV